MARPTWLTPNLMKLSWVSLLQDAASDMLYPLLPILLNSVFGAPALVVGLVESAAEGTAASIKLVSNRLNRWLSRKSMVVSGYSLAALGKLLIALAVGWPLVLLGRVVDRVGKGLRSAPRDTVLLEGADAAHRGKVIGFHRAADTTGAVIGPALALLLLGVFNNDVRSVLWFVTIPAVLSVAVAFLVKDTGKTKALKPVSAQKPQLPSAAGRLIWVLVAFSLLNFPDALILLHLSQMGWSVTAVVGAYLIFNLAAAALSFPFGALSDRVAPHRIFALGVFCFAAVYLGLGLSQNPAFDAGLLVLYGAFAAANDSVGKSWVSKLVGGHHQLAVQARLQGLSGYAVLFAGLWAGLFWGVSGAVPLLLSGGLALVVAVAILVLGNRSFSSAD